MPRATRAKLESQNAAAARGAAAAKDLDPLDRMAIDFEHMLPGSGDPVRLARLVNDPVAFDYTRLTMEGFVARSPAVARSSRLMPS